MNRTLKADALKSTSLTLGPLEAAAVEAVSFVTKNISMWYVKCELHCLQDTLEEEAAALASEAAAATPAVVADTAAEAAHTVSLTDSCSNNH